MSQQGEDLKASANIPKVSQLFRGTNNVGKVETSVPAESSPNAGRCGVLSKSRKRLQRCSNPTLPPVPTNANGTLNLMHYTAWLVRWAAGGRRHAVIRAAATERTLPSLNSTPLGEVLNERQLHAIARGPVRIGDARHVDLAHAAYRKRHALKNPGDPYEKLKDRGSRNAAVAPPSRYGGCRRW